MNRQTWRGLGMWIAAMGLMSALAAADGKIGHVWVTRV